MMLMNFSNFLLEPVYPSMAYSNKNMSSASSLYMTQLAGREPNSFQQLSGLIELKFISTA